MFSVEVPVLVSVTFFAGEVLPITIVPQLSEDGDTVTDGPVPLGFTVNERVVVSVKLPEVPVIVTVDVPVVAVGLAVRVSVLVVLVGFGLKPAVTPLGRPEALKVTLPLKPFCGVTVIVLVPLAPWRMVTVFGLAPRVNPAAATTSTTIAFDSIPLATT